MTTRKELIEGVGARYRSAAMSERTKILDEFVAITGYHRKHAIRVLGAEAGQERLRPARKLLALGVVERLNDRVRRAPAPRFFMNMGR